MLTDFEKVYGSSWMGRILRPTATVFEDVVSFVWGEFGNRAMYGYHEWSFVILLSSLRLLLLLSFPVIVFLCLIFLTIGHWVVIAR